MALQIDHILKHIHILQPKPLDFEKTKNVVFIFHKGIINLFLLEPFLHNSFIHALFTLVSKTRPSPGLSPK